MTAAPTRVPTLWTLPPWQVVAFVLLQAAVMLAAIGQESLWIDEFWTAHFANLPSTRALLDLLLIPSGSQTPLHFAYYYAWGQVFPTSEWSLRLANLPFFVLGQGAMFWALRSYPPRLSAMVLLLGALHPLVWQYANESRPYIMMLGGSQMILAYLLHLRAAPAGAERPGAGALAVFVVGSILLFGASLLGSFWVLSGAIYALVLHAQRRSLGTLLKGGNAVWLGVAVVVLGALTLYYASSLLQGAGASRISSSSLASVAFAAYELLGLSGVGPGRLELRSGGAGAVKPYAPVLLLMSAFMLWGLARGVQAAWRQLDRRTLVLVAVLGLLPIAVVLASGFAMQWRVLGRHLIATLPLLNLLLAAGLLAMLEDRGRWRVLHAAAAVTCLMLLAASSGGLRLSDRHAKDDYRAAAAIAQAGLAQGQRVWWAADYIGAVYYRLPGEFDAIGVLTSRQQPEVCVDRPGIQAVSNLTPGCLQRLSRPDLVVFSKPDVFDQSGAITRQLQAWGLQPVQDLPAFTVWRAPAMGAQPER